MIARKDKLSFNVVITLLIISLFFMFIKHQKQVKWAPESDNKVIVEYNVSLS